MIILDNTYDAKNFSPLVYDEKVIKHYKNLKEGTVAYDDFWDEQDYYLFNGYKPRGKSYHKITGEHYGYLNLVQIEMLLQGEHKKRNWHPYYRELDHTLFQETSQAKKHKYGLIVGKPRRVGMSWFGVWQMVFTLITHIGAKTGICAGLESKTTDFLDKVKYMLEFIRPEYAVSMNRWDEKKKKVTFGYEDIVNKQVLLKGLRSEIHYRTMFQNPEGFEGQSLDLVIFEEAGLFQNLIASYKSTEPAFREGSIQFGTPLIYGTGGEIEKGSSGYMEMWNNYSSYNLNKIFINATDYLPGGGEIDKTTGKLVPNFFDIRTGKTDRAAARKWVLEGRELAKKSKAGYTKHVQTYPLEEREIFIKTKGGILDRIKLTHQQMMIDEGISPYDIEQGRLEWVDDDITRKLVTRARNVKEACKIRIERGSKVKFVLDDNFGLVYKLSGFNPINNDMMQHKPDIGGCDSYDEEVQEGKGSDGATIIYRTYHGEGKDCDLPICFLQERGDSSSDDTFYENTLKLAVFWNCEILVEYSKIGIITHFKDVGAERYLRNRPDLSAYISGSRSSNEYGQRMTGEHKVLGTKLLKKEVLDNYDKIWFIQIIIDLIDYGDKNTDIAMAYVMVLYHKLDLFEDMVIDFEEDYLGTGDNIFDSMFYYDVDLDGNVQLKTYGEDNDNIPIFDPEFDLSIAEKNDIRMQKIEKKKEFEERKKEFEENKLNSLNNLIKDEILRSQIY